MHPLADAGRVIAGRYRLEAPIGRGAMGVVWRARDLLLDRDVAVKEAPIAETLTDLERATGGPLFPRRPAEVGRQLLPALSVAHAGGVIHRDVKPSSVLHGRDE